MAPSCAEQAARTEIDPTMLVGGATAVLTWLRLRARAGRASTDAIPSAYKTPAPAPASAPRRRPRRPSPAQSSHPALRPLHSASPHRRTAASALYTAATMSSYYSYSDDDDIDIREYGRHRSPQYVDIPERHQRQRPRSYYAADPGFLDGGAAVLAPRSVSRDRFRGRRASPPLPAAAPAPAPVVINNRIYHEYSSDDDDRHHLQLATRHRSRSRSRSSPHVLTREEFEMERTRRELAQLKLSRDMEARERRRARELEEEAELKAAQEELKGIKQAQAREEAEKQIKKELEFKRLKEEEREAEEKEKREKEAEAAVERYKQEELERTHKEKKDLERREREYQRRMQEHLFQSGLDEDAVEAIMKNKKIPEPRNERQAHTHTRMARRHLSFETLRTFDIEYTLDEVRFRHHPLEPGVVGTG